MKFMHLADLHIGKRVNEYSMIEDQKYILKKILKIIDSEEIEGVIIAGDVYDKAVPSAEAVELFDDFLVKLAQKNLKVFVISGNHDSPERIAFGGRLMQKSNIYMSPVYNGKVEPIKLNDEYGELNIYMLPFIKPANVRKFYEDEEINSYTDAMKVAIKNMNLDKNKRNILITHQFVTGASRTESEEISVGGTDNIDVWVFEDFDYVALGHIHRAQSCGLEKVRYSGTPLKYSFSESKDKKSVTIIEINEKENLKIKTIDLVPLRDMHEIKGKYNEIMLKEFYENTNYQEDYMHITLTDEEDIPDAIGKLRTVYHNLMKLDYDNVRTRKNNCIDNIQDVENKSPFNLFSEFYKKQNNQEMNQKQKEFISKIIEEIWEEEK